MWSEYAADEILVSTIRENHKQNVNQCDENEDWSHNGHCYVTPFCLVLYVVMSIYVLYMTECDDLLINNIFISG